MIMQKEKIIKSSESIPRMQNKLKKK